MFPCAAANICLFKATCTCQRMGDLFCSSSFHIFEIQHSIWIINFRTRENQHLLHFVEIATRQGPKQAADASSNSVALRAQSAIYPPSKPAEKRAPKAKQVPTAESSKQTMMKESDLRKNR